MKKINIILILLLLINSCEQHKHNNNADKNNTYGNRLQKNGKKTHETILKDKLNDGQKKGLEFLKTTLENENNFNKFLSLNENEIKDALSHIQNQLEKCKDEPSHENLLKIAIKAKFEPNNFNPEEFKQANGCIKDQK
ncbi:Mlp family lipoprotein [Borrelia hispanica]|uniref:Mlp family lipoprotein n=1 Tax=Borrelia hispanica TaxID=40835 RepID=UPI0004675708|nr:Mlp family lipoprotein [Borrelia hispanica]